MTVEFQVLLGNGSLHSLADPAREEDHGDEPPFLREGAAPASVELLPPGPSSGVMPAEGVEGLRQDLLLLEQCSAVPPTFPSGARSLIVEAGADRIVAPESRAALSKALPDAEHWSLAAAGHSLLGSDLVEPVLNWLEAGH